MANKVKPIPEGYHAVTPYLTVRDAARALDFYKQAFGAQELMRMPAPDGRVAHAEIKIGDSIVMLGDEFPQGGCKAPVSLGGTTTQLFLYVPDVDAAFDRAVKAGAKASMPPTDMFWGDRYGKVTDPFGHEWGMATHVEDVPESEMAERARKAMAQMQG